MLLENLFTPTGFWNEQFLNNTIFYYLMFLLITVLIFLFLKLFKTIILHRLKKISKNTKNKIDDLMVFVIDSFSFLFLFYVGVYFGSKILVLHTNIEKALNVLLIAFFVYQFSLIVQALTNYLPKKSSRVRSNEASFKLLGKIFKATIWLFGVLLILSNLGINITSLIAGLGIGGVAAALALQNILGDLFSSFAIHFDKPFLPGDFIVIGKHAGEVKKIGVKTTRIKSLQGEEIVISNKDLTSARVQNFKKMNDRRIAFQFGLEYDLDQDALKKIKSVLTDIIKNTKLVRFDRVHLTEFGDSSLNFEAVYFVESPDYNVYRDVHEKILLKMKQEFSKMDASFAYPTQTVYLKK